MPLETVLGAVLVVATAGLFATMLIVAIQARKPLPGVAARVACPNDGKPADVRIGRDSATRQLVVLWCDRFPNRKIGCRQECFMKVVPTS